MLVYKMLGMNEDRETGDVGIEIEVEGERLALLNNRYWKWEHDGSLRNGIEYVTKGSVSLENVPDALKVLINGTRNSEFSFSFRTSVHVHVNCLDLTYKQLLNFIYISTLMDSILVNYCGDKRKANRFCLRLRDAEGMVEGIAPLFRQKGDKAVAFERIIPRNQVRYAAVNVESIAKYGTIEFRSMRGTTDPKILIPWIETLVHLREFAKGFDCPAQIFNAICEEGGQEFLHNALGKHYETFKYYEMESDLALNTSLTIELPHQKVQEEQETMFQVHGEYWTVDEIMDEYPRDPGVQVMNTFLVQGALSNPILAEYFLWEEYKNTWKAQVDMGRDLDGVYHQVLAYIEGDW